MTQTLSSPPSTRSDATLIEGALAAVVDLDDLTAGRALGVSHATLRQWRRGARPKLKFHTRRLLQAFADKATALVGGQGRKLYRSVVVPPGRVLDPVSVAVGEFYAIQRIAGDLAKFAGEAGARLAGQATVAPTASGLVRAPTFGLADARAPKATARPRKAERGPRG